MVESGSKEGAALFTLRRFPASLLLALLALPSVVLAQPEQGRVTLVYPVDTAVSTNAPELQWQAVPGAEFYELRLFGELPDGRLLLAEERYRAQLEAICLEGVCQVTSPAAITVPVVFWQVRAVVGDADAVRWADADGSGPWSTEGSFTLAEGARSVFSTGVPRPDAIGPSGETEKLAFELDPNFRWTHQQDASGYTLALWYREGDQLYPLKTEVYQLNASIRDTGLDCGVANACIVDPILPLTKDVDYSWAVRAEFGEEPGPWSELLRFEMIEAAAFRFEFVEYADLELALQSPSRRTPVPGDVIPLIIDIENIGPQQARSLEVSLGIPEGLAYFWDTSAARKYDPDEGIWIIDVLSQHSTEQLTVYLEAVEPGSYDIEAEIIAYDDPLLDPDSEAGDGSGDDIDSVSLEVVRAPVGPNVYPFGLNPNLLDLSTAKE